MTKLYFTDPIKALYMMKEFGIKFYADTESGLINFADFEVCEGAISIEELFKTIKTYPKKLYIAKESEHIFEPKEGDIGAYFKNNKILFANLLKEGTVSVWIEAIDRRVDWVSDQVVITMRDGKHFFNAENETN